MIEITELKKNFFWVVFHVNYLYWASTMNKL